LADIEEACTLRKCFFQGNHSLNTKEQTNELNKMYSLNEREKTEYVEIVNSRVSTTGPGPGRASACQGQSRFHCHFRGLIGASSGPTARISGPSNTLGQRGPARARGVLKVKGGVYRCYGTLWSEARCT